jgi:hypothetical protein
MRTWIIVGIILQVAMALAGHWLASLRAFWGPGGMLISLVVGCLAAPSGGTTWGGILKAGALAGGIGAFVGILLVFVLQDVPALLIAFGTISSTVAGMIGAGAVAAIRGQTTAR